MPVEITIDPERRRIRSRLSGRLCRDTLRAYYEALTAHPDFRPDLSEVFDVSDVSELDLTADEIRDFSAATASAPAHGAGMRVAIVAPTDLVFGLARLYELSQVDAGNRICVLRTLAEAEAWLDASGTGAVGD